MFDTYVKIPTKYKIMHTSNFTGFSATPWGKLPLLEVDGKTVTQHLAICRYLGKKAGLNGKDDWEALKIDEIVDIINELRSGM